MRGVPPSTLSEVRPGAASRLEPAGGQRALLHGQCRQLQIPSLHGADMSQAAAAAHRLPVAPEPRLEMPSLPAQGSGLGLAEKRHGMRSPLYENSKRKQEINEHVCPTTIAKVTRPYLFPDYDKSPSSMLVPLRPRYPSIYTPFPKHLTRHPCTMSMLDFHTRWPAVLLRMKEP